jgi:hypothetical protein
MKTWKIYYGDQVRATVVSEKVFVTPEGRLSFFNTSGENKGGNVAGFAPNSWTFYKEATDEERS